MISDNTFLTQLEASVLTPTIWPFSLGAHC